MWVFKHNVWLSFIKSTIYKLSTYQMDILNKSFKAIGKHFYCSKYIWKKNYELLESLLLNKKMNT